MQNESELWYPIADQQAENLDNSGTDTTPEKPPKVQLPHVGNTKKSAKADDEKDTSETDTYELAALLRERINRQEQVGQLAREAEVCHEFDNAVSTIFSGAEATAEARQAFARFDPRNPDPQVFEFRNFVSSEFEKYGYF